MRFTVLSQRHYTTASASRYIVRRGSPSGTTARVVTAHKVPTLPALPMGCVDVARCTPGRALSSACFPRSLLALPPLVPRRSSTISARRAPSARSVRRARMKTRLCSRNPRCKRHNAAQRVATLCSMLHTSHKPRLPSAHRGMRRVHACSERSGCVRSGLARLCSQHACERDAAGH
jgi:hypothetical protein